MNDDPNELGRLLVRAIIVAGVFIVGMMVWGQVRAVEVMIAKDSAGNSMTLHNSPCVDGKVLALIVAQVHPKYQTQFRAGVMIYQGKVHQACWLADSGLVYVIDDSGDLSSMPQEAFKRAHGV